MQVLVYKIQVALVPAKRLPGVNPSHNVPVLRVRDLHVRLHRSGRANNVLRGVDLSVEPGEIVALVGESGSGKSTLGFAVQGLLPDESGPQLTGSIQVCAEEIVGASREQLRNLRRDRLGAVSQDPMTSLNPTMRVGRQIAEAVHDRTPTVDWLERVGIPDPHRRQRAYPHELSGGQRQRVMIAIAMASRPALVIADEPTTALDVTVQSRILSTFRSLRDELGTAFLFVTHDLAVAAATADRIIVLYGGRVVEVGDVKSVIAAPGHPYTAALLESRFGLDVEKAHQLPTLPGESPSAGLEQRGCAFAPRCLLVMDMCTQSTPAVSPITQHDGGAACHRAKDVIPRLWQQGVRLWPPRSTHRPLEGAPTGVVVEARGVTKAYGHPRAVSSHALKGVDLVVDAEEAVALVGESGSGKTTLLRIIAGLVEPTSGQVSVRSLERPQMVYQDASASLTPWMTVGELVGERLRRRGLSRSTRNSTIGQALDRVGLPEALIRARPAQLSGGQRQRVAIARAIVVPPRLLLCDEPVSSLDVSLAASILNLLESIRRELGMAMLFVTHDLAAARFAADRVVVMYDGLVVEDGPADHVVHHPAEPYTRELLASMPVRDLEVS